MGPGPLVARLMAEPTLGVRGRCRPRLPPARRCPVPGRVWAWMFHKKSFPKGRCCLSCWGRGEKPVHRPLLPARRWAGL